MVNGKNGKCMWCGLCFTAQKVTFHHGVVRDIRPCTYLCVSTLPRLRLTPGLFTAVRPLGAHLLQQAYAAINLEAFHLPGSQHHPGTVSVINSEVLSSISRGDKLLIFDLLDQGLPYPGTSPGQAAGITGASINNLSPLGIEPLTFRFEDWRINH